MKNTAVKIAGMFVVVSGLHANAAPAPSAAPSASASAAFSATPTAFQQDVAWLKSSVVNGIEAASAGLSYAAEAVTAAAENAGNLPKNAADLEVVAVKRCFPGLGDGQPCGISAFLSDAENQKLLLGYGLIAAGVVAVGTAAYRAIKARASKKVSPKPVVLQRFVSRQLMSAPVFRRPVARPIGRFTAPVRPFWA